MPDPGTEMVEAIRTGLPRGVELDEREDAILDLAARQARDVHAAEADIAERGYLVTTVPPNSVGVTIDLILGPHEYTQDELELAWEAYGEELMSNCIAGQGLPGTRPLGVLAIRAWRGPARWRRRSDPIGRARPPARRRDRPDRRAGQ